MCKNVGCFLCADETARRGLREHSFKLLQGASHRRRRGSAFSVRLVKYWKSSRLQSLHLLLSMFSRKGWRKYRHKSFSISPIDWTLISLFPYSPPIPHAHHPLTDIISIYYSNPCCIYVVSSGPSWPTFYHYKSLSVKWGQLPNYAITKILTRNIAIGMALALSYMQVNLFTQLSDIFAFRP